MRSFVHIVVAIGLMTGAPAAQTIEQQTLPPPGETGEESGGEEWGGASSPLERAPFISHRNFGPFLPERIEQADTVVQRGTRLRQLDKMTGRIQTLDVPVGSEVVLDRLTVQVEACRTRGEEGGGAISFLRIRDAKNADQEPIFSGWMFAESPALSALDHPRYDVWVISCIAASGGIPSANE